MIKIGENRPLNIPEDYLMDNDILNFGNHWNDVVDRVEDLIIDSTAFNNFLTYCTHYAINQLVKEGLIKYDINTDTFSIIESEDKQKARLLRRLDVKRLIPFQKEYKKVLTFLFPYDIIRL